MSNSLNNRARKVYMIARALYLVLSISILINFTYVVVTDYSQILKNIYGSLSTLTIGLGLLFNTLYFNNIAKNTEINSAILYKYLGSSITVVVFSQLFTEIRDRNYWESALYILLLFLYLISYVTKKKNPPK